MTSADDRTSASVGDSTGDLVAPAVATPVTGGHKIDHAPLPVECDWRAARSALSEIAQRGRFWALSEDCGEDEDADDIDADVLVSPSSSDWQAQCSTPTSAGSRDLGEKRARRREDKRRAQRQAAIALSGSSPAIRADEVEGSNKGKASVSLGDGIELENSRLGCDDITMHGVESRVQQLKVQFPATSKARIEKKDSASLHFAGGLTPVGSVHLNKAESEDSTVHHLPICRQGFEAEVHCGASGVCSVQREDVLHAARPVPVLSLLPGVVQDAPAAAAAAHAPAHDSVISAASDEYTSLPAAAVVPAEAQVAGRGECTATTRVSLPALVATGVLTAHAPAKGSVIGAATDAYMSLPAAAVLPAEAHAPGHGECTANTSVSLPALVATSVLTTDASQSKMGTLGYTKEYTSSDNGMQTEDSINDIETAHFEDKDVIAYGGIASPLSAGIRSSDRIRAQPLADLPAMYRAMMMAQRRDEEQNTGYSPGHILDSYVVLPSSAGTAGSYGFWMHSLDGGRSGYLQPGWLAAY